MGLARELRRMGHEARVLGPCDGPPPASFVHPLGNSLPTAIERLRRSDRARPGRAVPHDPAADRRGLRRPAPARATRARPDRDRAVPASGADRRHLPRGRRVANGYKIPELVPLRWLGRRIDQRVVVFQGCARADPAAHGRRVRGAVQRRRGRALPRRRAAQAGRPDDLLLRPPRGAQGPRRAARRVPTSSPDDVRLLIGSYGPDTKRLRAQAGDDPRIEWLGRLSDADKIAYLKGSSVFCAPSLRGESFGVVLIEAMAAGTPVVASSLDGYQNVATDGVDALLPEPGDADDARRRAAAGARRAGARRAAAHRGRACGPTTSA